MTRLLTTLFMVSLLPATGGAAALEEDAGSAWLRNTSESGVKAVLEVATRKYSVPDNPEMPDVWLVGAAHIGAGEYYDAMAELMDRCDIVLYESVIPEGARIPTGSTDEERRAATQASLDLLGESVLACRRRNGELPGSLEDLRRCALEADTRLGGWVDNASTDAWGNAVEYALQEEPPGFVISSRGGDGLPGGTDMALDLQAHVEVEVEVEEDSEKSDEAGDQLQAMLAESLGLSFQLDALPYESVNWRVSDQSIEATKQAFLDRGMDFSMLGGTMAGTSVPGQLIRMIVGLIPLADALSGGAMSDSIKVVLIELLSHPASMQMTAVAYGNAFEEIIVNWRNDVPLDDLALIIEKEPDIESVAILYGAAHMPEMEGRLQDRHGYVVEETHWIPAITVDLASSNLSPADLKMVRRSIRLALARMKREVRLAREREEAETSGVEE